MHLVRGPLNGLDISFPTELHIKAGDRVFKYAVSPFAMYVGEEDPSVAPTVDLTGKVILSVTADHFFFPSKYDSQSCTKCGKGRTTHPPAAEEGT